MPLPQLSKSQANESSSRFPKRSPYEKRCPSPDPFLNILQGPQQGSPPSRFPSQSSHKEGERLNLQSPFQPYIKVPGRCAHSRLPNSAPKERDAHPKGLTFVTFSDPRKEAPLPDSPNRAPIEKDAPFPETLTTIFQSSW
jgi:hypothetical protein